MSAQPDEKSHSHEAIDYPCESPERTSTRLRDVSFGNDLQHSGEMEWWRRLEQKLDHDDSSHGSR